MEIEQLIIRREMKVYYSLLSCRQVIQTTCQKGLLYYASAKQLYILLSWTARDIFAASVFCVFYHQSCHKKFATKPVIATSQEEMRRYKIEDFLNLFMYKVTIKLVRDKAAYLLHELLRDIKYLNTEHELETLAAKHASSLKRYLMKHFPEEIEFLSSVKYLVFHPININPCTYSVATLHGYGFHDSDLQKAFGKMIYQKLQDRKVYWPWSYFQKWTLVISPTFITPFTFLLMKEGHLVSTVLRYTADKDIEGLVPRQ